MHYVEFKDRQYPIYTKEEADAEGIEYKKANDDSKVGQYIETDTGFVLEVLASGNAGTTHWIRTACGTYPINESAIIGHTPRKFRYNFSGKGPDSHSLTKACKLFVQYYARSGDPVASYKRAFPKAKSEKYIKQRINVLLNTPVIREEVNLTVREELARLGADKLFTAREAKELYDEIKGLESKNILEQRGLQLRVLKFLDKLQKDDGFSATETVKESFRLKDDAAEAMEGSRKVSRSITRKLAAGGENEAAEADQPGGSEGRGQV